MTEAENRKNKAAQWRALYRGIRIEQFFPTIERIDISYVNHHGCIFGEQTQERTWTLRPQDEAIFVIGCLNPECSTIGFNLDGVIRDMIRNNQSQFSGEMECEGQEAPDHPEQSCEGRLKYSIRITYK